MSYDLFFISPNGKLTLESFSDYFRGRPNYQCEGKQIGYENEDTGVYFTFEYCADGEDADADEEGPPFAASFNINYYRPHFFGLEAAGELEAFVRHFQLAIDDPQKDGMDTGPFTREGFLRGWNHGNQFGYYCIQDPERESPPAFTLPTAELDRIWHWNFAREAMQERIEDNFVPRIMFLEYRGRACTAAVWPDGIPICLPKCDLVFVVRDELKTDPKVDKEVGLVEWSTLAPLLDRFPFQTEHGGYYELTYPDPEPLPIVVDFLQSQMLLQPQPDSGLAPDSVLNAELIAEARSQPRKKLDLN